MRRALVGRRGTRLGLFGATLMDSDRTCVGYPWLLSGVRRTLNNRLRTGTDKGNLTV